MGDRADSLHLPPARVLTDSHPIEGQNPVVQAEPVSEPEPLRNQNNYRISDDDRLGTGSLKRKCHDNLAAIELLKRLETEARPPTTEEMRVLVRYVGWGGLPQVFDSWNEEWKAERERLEALLTPEELDSARATTLNAHYTAPVVIIEGNRLWSATGATWESNSPKRLRCCPETYSGPSALWSGPRTANWRRHNSGL